jgi:hypothetical protein
MISPTMGHSEFNNRLCTNIRYYIDIRVATGKKRIARGTQGRTE